MSPAKSQTNYTPVLCHISQLNMNYTCKRNGLYANKHFVIGPNTKTVMGLSLGSGWKKESEIDMPCTWGHVMWQFFLTEFSRGK